jgi:IS30 family transposase
MNSTVGRPRSLTDAQVATILDWHRNRKTVADFARELGVSKGAVAAAIRCGGIYKQASPERRSAARAVLQRRRRELEDHALL